MKSDKDIVVFYTEDVEETFKYWMKFIRDTWSSKSQGARSLEKALEILEGDSFKPDMAIFDRGILRHGDDAVDDELAGDQLYYELLEIGIPVAVLSGHPLERTKPYSSKPPQLGFYTKPTTEKSLRQAVDAFKQLKVSES